MAFCSGMMLAVTVELDSALRGARVDRITQPERETVFIVFRTADGAKKLIINASSDSPRVSLTGVLPENPAAPPMFTMLLRKYLSGARVDYVRQSGFERVAVIGFTGRDDFNEARELKLVCEIMGRNSNIILTGEGDRIIGALHTADFAESVRRRVMPGLPYAPPPAQDKLDPTAATREEFTALAEKSVGKSADRFIVDTFFGISPLTAREIAFLSLASYIDGKCIPVLCDNFFTVIDNLKCGRFSPCVLRDPEGIPREVSFFPIKQYGEGYVCERYQSPSAALDDFYLKRDAARRKKEKTQSMIKNVGTVIARLERKTALQMSELRECEKADELRRCGEIILANLFAITGKSDRAELTDYYTEGCPRVVIPLDPKLGARQNADRYFKKYAKLKRAESILAGQIADAESELEYLRTVLSSIELCDNEQELREIRTELVSAGVLRDGGAKNQPKKKQTFAIMTLSTRSGRQLLVGKNNLQNDYVTHVLAEKSDWWFHVKNAPGSHVIMKCSADEDPPAEDFNEAIALAAKYSGLRDSADIPVDYTRVRNIKKPPGSRPGYVTYSTNYTAYYKPEKAK